MYVAARDIHRLVFLAIAALTIALSFIDFGLPYSVQLGLLAAGVALLGLPHGALDPLLARTSGVVRTPGQLMRFLASYVAQAMLVVVFWWLAPVAALVGFLLFSVWHFRGDWKEEASGWQAVSAASTVILAPAVFHPSAVAEVFTALSFGAPVEFLVSVMQSLGWAALASLGLTVLRLGVRQARLALELMSLPLLAWALPPLLFFVVYFCALHSPRHIIDSLYTMRVRWQSIVLTAASITVLTIFLAIAAHGLSSDKHPNQALLAIVFIGLAALTVPHMLLIERLR